MNNFYALFRLINIDELNLKLNPDHLKHGGLSHVLQKDL